MAKLAKFGDFCPNKGYPDNEKLQSASQHNIIKAGKSKAGVQRYECVRPAIVHLQRQKVRCSVVSKID